jgi:hypothetical protein
MDRANAPIQNAYVLLHRSHTTDMTVQTDERGQFTVDLSPGLYDIFVASDGFTPSCKVIKIIASKAVHPGFVLQVDMEHMQVDPVQTGPPVDHR